MSSVLRLFLFVLLFFFFWLLFYAPFNEFKKIVVLVGENYVLYMQFYVMCFKRNTIFKITLLLNKLVWYLSGFLLVLELRKIIFLYSTCCWLIFTVNLEILHSNPTNPRKLINICIKNVCLTCVRSWIEILFWFYLELYQSQCKYVYTYTRMENVFKIVNT